MEIIRSTEFLSPKMSLEEAKKFVADRADILGYVFSEWFDWPAEDKEMFFPRHPNSMIEVKENAE